MRIILSSFTLFMLISLAGCSIYRMDIRQGNIVEQKDVDKIKLGMNKEQIRFILGQPVIHDTFDNSKWYYLYTNKNGKTGEKSRKELIIIFQNDKVSALKGDFKLSAGPDEATKTPLQNSEQS